MVSLALPCSTCLSDRLARTCDVQYRVAVSVAHRAEHYTLLCNLSRGPSDPDILACLHQYQSPYHICSCSQSIKSSTLCAGREQNKPCSRCETTGRGRRHLQVSSRGSASQGTPLDDHRRNHQVSSKLCPQTSQKHSQNSGKPGNQLKRGHYHPCFVLGSRNSKLVLGCF